MDLSYRIFASSPFYFRTKRAVFDTTQEKYIVSDFKNLTNTVHSYRSEKIEQMKHEMIVNLCNIMFCVRYQGFCKTLRIVRRHKFIHSKLRKSEKLRKDFF